MARPSLDEPIVRGPTWPWVAGGTAVVCLPLIIAVASFRRPVWSPVLDLAMTELRVRDVGGRHTPLIGLPGRIGTLERQGSHPGPLSFYALAPTYRALGSTSWALQIAALVVHAVAIATALALAARRAGPRLVVAVGALLAVLTAGYGGGALTEPWNPYLPLLAWVVVLLATWAVVDGDVPMLLVLVIAGSFSAQTHIPYLGLTMGMGGLALLATVVTAVRDPGRRSRSLRWMAAAAGAGLLLWLPPTLDQIRREPGNYELLVEHFSEPPEAVQGLGVGVREGLRYLDLVHLGRGASSSPGLLITNAHPTPARGAVVVAVWAISAAVALARRYRHLLALHAVVGASLVLMVVAISRIFGALWYYLTLWGWAIGLLALLATGWTAVTVVAERWSTDRRERAARVGTMALGSLALAVALRFAVVAPDSAHADPTVAAELETVVDEVAAGLRAGNGAATGTEGRYLLTWTDAFHIGSQGYGLLNELERRGFEVGVGAGRRVPATGHRVIGPGEATAGIHLATGVFVDRYASLPGAVEIAFVDPRSPEQRAEQEALRKEVIAELKDLGFDDLVARVDENLFGAAIDQRLPDDLQERMGRMLEIGTPLAVFVVPPGTPDP